MDGTAISKVDNRYRKSADVSNIIKVQTHEFTVQNLQEMPAISVTRIKTFHTKVAQKVTEDLGYFI